MNNKERKFWRYGIGVLFAMVICMVLSVSNNAFAAEANVIESGDYSAEGSNVTWSLVSNGVDTYKLIFSGNGDMCEERILVENHDSAPWAGYVNSITEIEIKEGITNIGNNVFSCLEKLKKVSIASSVTRIEGRAFQQCTSLKTIKLPDGLTYIGWSAFNSCSKLNNVKIPDSVTQIDEYAFSDCAGLKKIILSKNLLEISEGLFFASHNLKTVKIPARVTKIGELAFSGKFKSMVIPDKVTEIGADAFGGCAQLSKITIGKNVRTIGKWAFYQTNIKSVNIKTTKLRKIGKGAFRDMHWDAITFKIAGNKKQRKATIKLLKKKSVGYEKGAWIFK
ncbi:MAG: leucine-rich repeat domain-containing protein [Lachnospiraceae bacterium]|nr:leucine-rich repeat domain-containing protein [Lachnospiraceae bacterium]